MQFNYEEENKKLLLANNNINDVISMYNNILSNLSIKERQIIKLFYYFKKYDAFIKMSEKYNYPEDKKNSIINQEMSNFMDISNKVYPSINNIDEIKKLVMNDMNGKLLEIVNSFLKDLKKAYKEYCEKVYIVLPIHGLKELVQSKNKENQFLNSMGDGVFATTTINGIYRYVGRAIAGSMRAWNNEVEYPSNPFSEVDEKGLTLIEPVSIYLADTDFFEPQIDYIIDSNGKAEFNFDGEWVAPYEKVPCVETQVTYIPNSFLDNNDVYYYEEGNRIQVTCETMKRS